MRRRDRFGTWCGGWIAALALVAGSSGASAATPPPPVDPAPYGRKIATDTPEGLAAYLHKAFRSIDGYWIDHFKQVGLKGPSLFYTLPMPGDTGYQSSCMPEPIVHNTPNFYHCPTDTLTEDDGTTFEGAVHFPVTTAMKLRDTTNEFAVATVLAHEYGHEAQHEYMEQRGWADIVQMKDGAPVLDETGNTVPVKEAELIADCFSGSWAKYAYQQGLVADTDLTMSIKALELAGDDQVGVPAPHGSKYERTAAFTLGYNQGPEQCVRHYWVTEIFD
ncbi:neutral zinc metallopeptidase [Streptomyces sp. NPDC051211]|uniref:neutral zinc metallopeptidase n=1 Tax=Streptomyces sp. NPDC051211 TaxID=3154643 RepID=UPI00344BA61F